MRKITIIGAGIGGLTTAIALKQKGFQVEVFDRANNIKRVGAGILLANNAMQIYDELGLRSDIEQKGNTISALNVTTPYLKTLSHINLQQFEKRYKVKNVAISRSDLHEILMNALSNSEIHLNHKLESITKLDNDYQLQFENQQSKLADTIIGADGLHSMVRASMFPDHKIRNARQICWRGMAKLQLPEKFKHELNEAWGKSQRFGFTHVSEDTVYWFALKSTFPNQHKYQIEQLQSCFGNYHPIIQTILKSTPKNKIHTAEIMDLKPTKQWYSDRICLIGDAAHATTPNLGQGACQAIEDAYVISQCLEKYTPKTAFEEFQKKRLPKVHQIVNTSWNVGKIAHLSNPFLVFLRNQVMRIMPNSQSQKQTESIFKLQHI